MVACYYFPLQIRCYTTSGYIINFAESRNISQEVCVYRSRLFCLQGGRQGLTLPKRGERYASPKTETPRRFPYWGILSGYSATTCSDFRESRYVPLEFSLVEVMCVSGLSFPGDSQFGVHDCPLCVGVVAKLVSVMDVVLSRDC